MSNLLGGRQGIAYRGTNAAQPPNWSFEQRSPTQYDSQNYSIGDLWMNQVNQTVWVLVSLAGNATSKGILARWITWGGFGNGDVATLTGNNTSVTVGVDANANINIVNANTTVDITGNSATNTLTQDFGITNLIIGSDALGITTAVNNVALGLNALASVTQTSRNVAIGVGSLQSAQVLNGQVAIGYNALNLHNTGAGGSIAIGESALEVYNAVSGGIAIGQNSQKKNLSGAHNTSLGTETLANCLTGNDNTAIGAVSHAILSTGAFNTSVGSSAGYAILIGSNNCCYGYNSGLNYVNAESSNICIGSNATGRVGESGVIRINTSDAVGDANIFIGQGSLASGYTVSTGQANVGVGYQNFLRVTTGHHNSSLGTFCLGNITTGNQNVAIGSNSLQTLSTGTNCTAVGYNSMALAQTNTSNSTGLGYNTLAIATAGDNNLALGSRSLQALLIGASNTCVGDSSGLNYVNAESSNICIGSTATGRVGESGVIRISNAVVGDSNTFIGQGAGNNTLTVGVASNNVGLGKRVLKAVTTAQTSVAIGVDALGSLTSGVANTCLGQASFSALTIGTNNVGIGHGSGGFCAGAESSNILIASGGALGESNTIRIGSPGVGAGQQDRCFIAGIRDVTTGVVDALAVLIDSAHQLGTASSSARYKENIQDLGNDSSIIMSLRPVKFNMKSHPGVPAWGLIAEEVAEIFPQLAVYKDGEPESVKYHDLPALLLNELQKQNKRIEELESQMRTLLARYV